MMRCPRCQTSVNLNDVLDGRLTRCPKCQADLVGAAPTVAIQASSIPVQPPPAARSPVPVPRSPVPAPPPAKGSGTGLILALIFGMGGIGLVLLFVVAGGLTWWFLASRSPSSPADTPVVAELPSAPLDPAPAPPVNIVPANPPVGPPVNPPVVPPVNPPVVPVNPPADPPSRPEPIPLGGVDLLKRIDLDKHVVQGKWKREGDALLSPKEMFARIQIPYAPPTEYELKIVAVPVADGGALDAFNIGLVGGDRQICAIVGGWGGMISGLDMADNRWAIGNATTYRGRSFTAGAPSTIIAQVRRASIVLNMDGKDIVKWNGEFNRFGPVFAQWKVPDAKKLFLGCHRAYEIRSMVIRPVGEMVAIPVPAPSPERPPEPPKSTPEPPKGTPVPEATVGAKELFVDLPERNEGGLRLAGVEPEGLPPGTKPAEKGKEYSPKNKQFTITMPAGQRTTERTKVVNVGRLKVPMELAQTTLADGTIFTAGSIGIPAVLAREIPAAERLATIRDILARDMAGKVVEEKDLTQGKLTGKDYLIEGPRSAARVRTFLNGGWILYAVVEGRNKARVTFTDSEWFYESFKVGAK